MNLERFEGHKVALREAYIGNECDTDEYGEAQPAKGVRVLAWAIDLAEGDGPTQRDLCRALRQWLEAYEPRYEGAEELAQALTLAFDVLWAHGEHPYCSSEEELREYLEQVVLDD